MAATLTTGDYAKCMRIARKLREEKTKLVAMGGRGNYATIDIVSLGGKVYAVVVSGFTD